MASIYLGMGHDLLAEVEAPQDMSEEGKKAIGFRYMLKAATAGDRDSMVFVARAFDTGCNLDDDTKKSAVEALKW